MHEQSPFSMEWIRISVSFENDFLKRTSRKTKNLLNQIQLFEHRHRLSKSQNDFFSRKKSYPSKEYHEYQLENSFSILNNFFRYQSTRISIVDRFQSTRISLNSKNECLNSRNLHFTSENQLYFTSCRRLMNTILTEFLFPKPIFRIKLNRMHWTIIANSCQSKLIGRFDFCAIEIIDSRLM